MKTSFAIFAVAALALAVATPADAKGCLKGAVVGGVAGHYAGHHGVVRRLLRPPPRQGAGAAAAAEPGSAGAGREAVGRFAAARSHSIVKQQ